MHQFFGDQLAYNLFNNISICAAIISSLFYFKSKRKSVSLYSRYAVFYTSRISTLLGKIVEIILVSLESVVLAGVAILSTTLNQPFGNLVGTGANYFGTLFFVSILWFLISLILIANPLKQIDIATMFLPPFLFFVKLACFCQGCCWGIPWEHGLYNHHPDHPGYQVPVQAFEAFWAVAIFIFLLWYRKKAKCGTMYPMYMILYSATRFCSEFFRREENVVWIFKTYHLLCIAGFIIGLALLLIMRKHGERLSDFFENPHIKFEQKVAEYEEKKLIEQIENEAKAKADEIERKEKARLARERAKARKK